MTLGLSFRSSTLRLLVVFVSFIIAWVMATPLADDAFITFRYAYNLQEGFGLVYNRDESVLGLTTPLWAVLLAGLQGMGGSFEEWSRVAALLSLGGLAVVFAHHYRGERYAWQAILFAPIAVGFYVTRAGVSSGMESVTYSLSVVGAISAGISGRPVILAVVGAAAVLLRPDGVLACGVGLIALLGARSWRVVGASCSVLGLILIPTLLFGFYTYGDVLPLSVQAKRLAHPAGPLTALQMLSQGFFSQRIGDFVAIVVGGAGLLHLVRDPVLWVFPAWCFLYLLGLVFSGIQPIFYWYYTPIWLLVIGLGPLGLLRMLQDAATRFEGRVIPCFGAVIVLLTLPEYFRRDPGHERDAVYHQIAAEFQDRIPATARLYLCETGILGYHFRDNYVFDASGINSRVVFDARHALSEAWKGEGNSLLSPDHELPWSVDFVRTHLPDWIISPRGYCQLAVMEEEAWFTEQYARQAEYRPDLLGGIRVYRRREPPAY